MVRTLLFLCGVVSTLSLQSLAHAAPQLRAHSSGTSTPVSAGKAHCKSRLVVSGAVSLGAYQAGWLYAYERYRIKYDCGPYLAVTGASAGATNALLAAIGSSGLVASSPRMKFAGPYFQHPLWHLWVETLDWQAMAAGDVAGPTHLLGDGPISGFVAKLATLLDNAAWTTNFETRFGATVTTATPRLVSARDIEFLRASEKIGLVVKGTASSGAGALAFVEDAAFAESKLGFCLTCGCNQAVPFALTPGRASVAALVQASGAFPFAFKPVSMTAHFDGGAAKVQLLDGGILNNNPLQLNSALTRTPVNTDLADTLYLDVDTGMRTQPLHGNGAASLTALLGALISAVLTGSNEGHLGDLVETIDFGPSVALNPRRAIPLAGEHFFALSGFFAYEFRAHDFLRGVEDATVTLRGNDYLEQTLRDDLATLAGSTPSTTSPVPGALNQQDWNGVQAVWGATQSLADPARQYLSAGAGARWQAFVDALQERMTAAGMDGFNHDGILKKIEDKDYYDQEIRDALQRQVGQAIALQPNSGCIARHAIARAADIGLDAAFGTTRSRWQFGVNVRSGTHYGALEGGLRLRAFRQLSGRHLYAEALPHFRVTEQAGAVAGGTLALGGVFAQPSPGVDIGATIGFGYMNFHCAETDCGENRVIPVDIRIDILKEIRLSLGTTWLPWSDRDDLFAFSLGIGYWPWQP